MLALAVEQRMAGCGAGGLSINRPVRIRGAASRWIALVLTIACGISVALLTGGRASAADADAPVRILALGDSLTAGYGLAAQDSFTAVLQRALRERGYAVEVGNSGVSGDTSAGGLARLDWALAEEPDAVIVELGANDALRGLDPAATRDNLASIVERLTDEGLPVLIAGMRSPPNLGREYAEAFEAIYADLAEQSGALLYPFFLDGVAADPTLNQADGIHPNEAGVRVIVDGILPVVERLIERVEAAPQG